MKLGFNGELLPFLNVGTGVDLSIWELAVAVAAATGYRGRIAWYTTKPDGTPKMQLDVSRLAELGGGCGVGCGDSPGGGVGEYRRVLCKVQLQLKNLSLA